MSKASEAMRKARAQVCLANGWKGAFYGTLAMHLELVETTQVPTLATDGSKLYYNPDYFLELSEDERITGIAHEALHCGLCHFGRMVDLPIQERNVCMDYPVNELLAKDGFKIPHDWLIDPQYYGKSAEQLHPILFPARKPQEPEDGEPEAGKDGEPEDSNSGSTDDAGEPGTDQADKGKPGADEGSTDQAGEPDGQSEAEGSTEAAPASAGEPGTDGEPSGHPGAGSHASGQRGERGEPSTDQASTGSGADQAQAGEPGSSLGESGSMGLDGSNDDLPVDIGADLGPGGILPAPLKSPAEATAEKQRWETIVRQAASAAKARNAGQIPGTIGQLITTLVAARIDWREALASFIDSRAVCRESWKRLDRRFMGRAFVMPGTVEDGIEHLVWAIDVSGSMDMEAFDNVASEIKSAFDEGKIAKLTVLYTNTEIVKVDEFAMGDDLEIVPPIGGGTDFRACMQWIADNAEDATAIVFFTDLIVSEFGQEPACDILWLRYGTYNNPRLPFGEVLPLN